MKSLNKQGGARGGHVQHIKNTLQSVSVLEYTLGSGEAKIYRQNVGMM